MFDQRMWNLVVKGMLHARNLVSDVVRIEERRTDNPSLPGLLRRATALAAGALFSGQPNYNEQRKLFGFKEQAKSVPSE